MSQKSQGRAQNRFLFQEFNAMKKNLAIITSHVIQYQAPLFKKISADPEINLTVYFCWDFGTKKTYDKQFGIAVEWDIPLLDGYRHKFLKNFSPKPSSDFWGEINPGAVFAGVPRQEYTAGIRRHAGSPTLPPLF